MAAQRQAREISFPEIALTVIRFNLIQGNIIGLGADGTTPVGNGKAGVVSVGVTENEIGGPDTGAGNEIAHNGGLGIDPLADGVVSTNVTNGEHNYPELTNVVSGGSSTTIQGIQGTLNAKPLTVYEIEFASTAEGIHPAMANRRHFSV